MARVYTLVVAPAGGARVEDLHAGDRDVALSYGETVDLLAEVWGEVLRRQRAMLTARTGDWRQIVARPVEVVVQAPGEVLDGQDVELATERAALRHFLRLIDRHGPSFGVQVRYAAAPGLAAVA